MPSVLPNLTPIRKLPFDQNLGKWLDKSYKFSYMMITLFIIRLKRMNHQFPRYPSTSELTTNFMFNFSKTVFPNPLPQVPVDQSWKFKSVTQLENFPAYIRPQAYFRKHLLHCWRVKRNLLQKETDIFCFSHPLRTVAPIHVTPQFNLPSISLLSKLKQGCMDSNQCVKILQKSGNTSEEVILMFDEMFLQCSEEFVGG